MNKQNQPPIRLETTDFTFDYKGLTILDLSAKDVATTLAENYDPTILLQAISMAGHFQAIEKWRLEWMAGEDLPEIIEGKSILHHIKTGETWIAISPISLDTDTVVIGALSHLTSHPRRSDIAWWDAETLDRTGLNFWPDILPIPRPSDRFKGWDNLYKNFPLQEPAEAVSYMVFLFFTGNSNFNRINQKLLTNGK
jgi:hypothetical protein